MPIIFYENEHNEEYFSVKWKATTAPEWYRALESIKKFVSEESRFFVKEEKILLIKYDASDEYIQAKEIALGEEKDDEVLESVNDQLLLNNFYWGRGQRTNKKNSLLVIKRLLGLIDGEVDFSFYKNDFGTYDSENQCWVYSDGSYSEYSPDDFDRQQINRAYEYVEKFKKVVLSGFQNEMDEINEKLILRDSLLKESSYKCYTCGDLYDGEYSHHLHMHRILSGKKGGKYIRENVVLVCDGCHHSIEGFTIEEINNVRNIGMELRKELSDGDYLLNYVHISKKKKDFVTRETPINVIENKKKKGSSWFFTSFYNLDTPLNL